MSERGADLGVMTAILMPLDGAVAGLVNEAMAIHSRQGRLTNRVRALENAHGEDLRP